MADTLYTSQTPVVQNDFDGSSHAWGIKFTVSSDCSLKGGRARVPTGGRPTTFLWQVWRMGDSTKIAESNLNDAGHGSPSAETWMSFNSSLFSTPGDVSLDNAETYIVCVAFSGGNGVYTDDGSESFPLTSGGLASGSTGRFTNAGGTNVMPGTDYVAYFFADVSVEAAGTEHTKSVGGTITPSGSITRTVNRSLAGSTTSTGTLSKQASRALTGSTTATGAITRAIDKALGGAVTATGAATRAISRTLSGSVSPAGAALKALSRLLGGSITPSGSMSHAPGQQDVLTSITVGRPRGRWYVGSPHGRWRAGRPRGE